MVVVRRNFAVLVAGLLVAAQLGAQGSTGTVSGRVVDAASQQPLANVNIVVVGTRQGAVSQTDGSFLVVNVPEGVQQVRASRIGFAPQDQPVVVTAGATVNAQFSLTAQAAVLSEVVSIGYGTQRREAITGSVATVDAEQANVGVVTNANQMVQGRVAGVQVTANSGEPGGGVQMRIRGGTSINASNTPLYVVDGVPLQNDETAPGAQDVGSISPALARSPLNAISPNDIESITVLKDASATAIYGSRGANGVILITTKRGSAAASGNMEYDVYVGAAVPYKQLEFASGAEYRGYIQEQVNIYVQDSLANRATKRGLPPNSLTSLGSADTDWEDELLRRGIATNHNLSFSGGTAATQYRASLNYFDQQGVVISSGIKRYQGRLNADHNALNGKLRLGLNLMAARVHNDYAPIENTGGFLGGLFTNMAIYNPTFPIRSASGSFYEVGTGAQDVRNPVALALQWDDEAPENRVLANVTGGLSILQNLTAQTTVGVDYSDAVRRTYSPRTSPIGAAFGGSARQAQRGLQNLNFQQLLTYSPTFFESHSLEMVGGYEYTSFEARGFEAQMRGFVSDAFNVNNLGAGTQVLSPVPTSYRVESKLVSFFGRANYGFANRYFLTGVLRRDGSSRLAPGSQWELFPAISASWRISEEPALRDMVSTFSTLALRAGWGKQGNQSVAPYQTQLLLRADPGATYPFGNTPVIGLRAAQVGNAELKWETSTQTNVGIDYGFMGDRVTGALEFYQKDTRDLLLEVPVPQPAVVSTRLENVGSLRNRGIEATIDAQLWDAPQRSLGGGLVFSLERSEITNLGEDRESITTGWVSGQGQTGQYSQRIMLGEPLGTFFGPRFLRVNNAGQQVFACVAGSTGCTNGETLNPTEDDKEILGNANPDFSVGLRNNLTWGSLDASWLWRGEFGREVFNNTALVYQTKGNAKQGRNFLRSALDMPDDLNEPSKFSSRWVEDASFVRLQNVTVGYTLALPSGFGVQSTRLYLSGDNLLLFTPYEGYDPEVFVATGLASRGIDYLTYPRPRTYTLGARVQF
jgi:TonB-dependent starch-binding outer membrane protein SusC